MNNYSIMEEEVKYLKSILDTKVNQYKMLSGTLVQMLSKNPHYTDEARQVKKELDETLEEITQIKNDLWEAKCATMFSSCNAVPNSKNDNKVTYSFYDKIKKDNKTKFNKFVDIEENSKVKDYVNEFRDTVDNRMRSNRFLVRIKDALEIPEIMVSSVSFNLLDKELSLCIYDFLSNVGDGTRIPILEILKYTTNEFNFSIDHLDFNGNVIYTEWYSGCKIKLVDRDAMDYSNDDFVKIQVIITYDNVDYETVDEKEK